MIGLSEDSGAEDLDAGTVNELVTQGTWREIEALMAVDGFDVYVITEVKQKFAGLGQKVPWLSTKWERTWKKDEETGLFFCRCRFVAREFKWRDPHRTDVFAPASSLSSFR